MRDWEWAETFVCTFEYFILFDDQWVQRHHFTTFFKTAIAEKKAYRIGEMREYTSWKFCSVRAISWSSGPATGINPGWRKDNTNRYRFFLYPRASHDSIFNHHDHIGLSFARSYPDSLRPDCTLSHIDFPRKTFSDRFVTQSIAIGFTSFEVDPPTVYPLVSFL